MARSNVRHIVTGVQAIAPRANAVTPYDLWVPVDKLPKVLKFIGEETAPASRPEIYGPSGDKVCLRL